MKPTALGYYLLVLPDRGSANGWEVAMFSRGGRWQAGVCLPSKAAAHAERRKLVRHHKRLAAEQAARAETRRVRA